MTQPKEPQNLKEHRDSLCEKYVGWGHSGNSFRLGFDSAVDILLIQIQALQSKLAEAEAKVLKLKRLILLVDEAVSKEQMNELSVKQWAEYLKDFPEDL